MCKHSHTVYTNLTLFFLFVNRSHLSPPSNHLSIISQSLFLSFRNDAPFQKFGTFVIYVYVCALVAYSFTHLFYVRYLILKQQKCHFVSLSLFFLLTPVR